MAFPGSFSESGSLSRTQSSIAAGGVTEEYIMSARINFYRTDDAYGCFSNFASFPITLDGVVWHTSEHDFQAQKFAGSPYAEEIRQVRSPMTAARMGRSREHPLRSDWEEVKDDVMRTAVRAKFTQHEDLRAILLSTEDVRIVEHTNRDNYWGDGGDGSGKNMLGRILMEIRAELRENAT